jgi:hypothetical protein
MFFFAEFVVKDVLLFLSAPQQAAEKKLTKTA